MMLLALSVSALSLRGVRVMSDIEREEIAKMEYTRPTSYSEFPNSSGHASRQAASVPDMWRDVDYEVPEQAQEVILVLGEKVVHGRGLGECFGTIIGKWRQQSGCPCPNHQIRRASNGSNNNFNGL